MNILLGSHGTGKTTVLQEIIKTHKGLYTGDGFSRPIKAVATSAHLTNIQQQKIINELTLWRWNEDLGKKNCIYTRSLIDTIIYTEELFPEIKTDILRSVFEDTYSPSLLKVFYIPIEFPLVKDNVRFEDEDFQRRIDELMKSFLDHYEIPRIILSGNTTMRKNKVLNNLL